MWFRFLASKIKGANLASGFKRMLADQTIAAPILTSMFIFSFNMLKEPHKIDVAANKTKELIIPVMISNYKVLITVVNFDKNILVMARRSNDKYDHHAAEIPRNRFSVCGHVLEYVPFIHD